MRLLPTNARDQKMVLIGIVGVVAVVAYWQYFLAPRALELDLRAEHVEQVTARNERAKIELARGDPESLRREAAAYRETLDAMRQLVPTSNEVPSLLEQVSTAARRVGLDIGSVEPEPVLPGDEFDTYRYKISVGGDYHAVGSFLANVGSLTRIIAPMNVQLQPTNVPQAPSAKPGDAPRKVRERQPLQTQFEIQTYVARAASAGAAAPEESR